MASAYYEIRLAGVFPRGALPGVARPTTGSGLAETCVFGPFAGQAALSALLTRLEELGVQVAEIRRLPPAAPLPEWPGAQW